MAVGRTSEDGAVSRKCMELTYLKKYANFEIIPIFIFIESRITIRTGIFVTERAGMPFRKFFLRRYWNGVPETYFPGISISNPVSNRILGHSMRSRTFFFLKWGGSAKCPSVEACLR
jgi:hypothetical protein